MDPRARKILLNLSSDEALSAWYTEFLVSGTAPLVTTELVEPGDKVTLLVSAGAVGPFEVVATVMPPLAALEKGTPRVTLVARADLREHLSRHALARKSGRILSSDPGRRKHPRFETFLRARFRSYQQLMDEYVTNISKGGLFIRTTQPTPMGSMVRVLVTFPNESEPREIQGEVVRVVTPDDATRTGVAPGVGIAFDTEEGAFAPAIGRLLESYLARAQRLLVVDDDALFLRMLSDHLLERGYEVLAAKNGYWGAKMLADHLYELDGVLLDLQMTGLDGMVLLDRIRLLKREASFRLVVISASSEEVLAPLRGAGGADDAVSKMLPFEELLARVQKALGSSKLS